MDHEDEATMQEMVRAVCAELKAHTTIEEEIFYPAAREALGDSRTSTIGTYEGGLHASSVVSHPSCDTRDHASIARRRPGDPRPPSDWPRPSPPAPRQPAARVALPPPVWTSPLAPSSPSWLSRRSARFGAYRLMTGDSGTTRAGRLTADRRAARRGGFHRPRDPARPAGGFPRSLPIRSTRTFPCDRTHIGHGRQQQPDPAACRDRFG